MRADSGLRRVVITGLGVLSPLGCSAAALWDGLTSGRSGVDYLKNLPPLEGRVVFGGEVRDFTGQIDDFGDLEKELKKSIRKALKMMCRESMMAVAAAQHALADAQLTQGAEVIDPDRAGAVFGSDYMLSPPEDFIHGMTACGAAQGAFRYSDWGVVGLREMNPLWMLNYLPNMPASHIAIFNDFRGPNNSLTMREASGLAAIREAAQIIVRGDADWMVAGATGGWIHPFKTIHAAQTEQLADPALAPSQAARPFDANRTGMVVGEGAGALVLEELSSAKARGARIYGELVGHGSASSSSPSLVGRADEALLLAGKAALSAADMKPSEVGHLAAHGLGTSRMDVMESRATAHLFGDRLASLPVAVAKSAMGNLGAASGLVETIASVLGLEAGRLYATQNYETPDPECPMSVTRDSDTPAGNSFLKWSVTPQGQAVAVVLRRFE